MKNIPFLKENLIIILIFFTLIGLDADKTSAESRWDQTNVPEDKIWTIDFNTEISEQSMNRNNIYVTYNNDHTVEQSLISSKNQKEITVQPPPEGYSPGTTYNLHVKNIASPENVPMQENIDMEFTIGKQENEKYVDVSVATLWSEPAQTRAIDTPSLENPVDMRKWTSSMAYHEKLWLVGELQTQALYGQEVTILDKQGDWVKVAVHDQPTPKNKLGYPAWMPEHQLTKGQEFSAFQSHNPTALVKAPTTFLYNDKLKSSKFKEISFNTGLPVITSVEDMIQVATPRGELKWIDSKAVKTYDSEDDIPIPSRDELVATAKQFLGLPYLWSGVSGFGFDCSGFTSAVYKSHGITIPRDSSVQAVNGTYVAKENLQKGDLLFFAYNNGKGSIHHVGMYIGDGEMIHSPNSRSTVEIIDVFDTAVYASEYAGARRYLD